MTRWPASFEQRSGWSFYLRWPLPNPKSLESHELPSQSLTWNLKMAPWKRRFLFGNHQFSGAMLVPSRVLGHTNSFSLMLWFSHQEFQVPKMEVLNLVRLFWWWVFPYISLIYSLYRWGFLHVRYLKCLVIQYSSSGSADEGWTSLGQAKFVHESHRAGLGFFPPRFQKGGRQLSWRHFLGSCGF